MNKSLESVQISRDFKLGEFYLSYQARINNIDNTPPDWVIENIKTMTKNLLQPFRDYIDRPILITSGYRCEKLNKIVGGSPTSRHMLGLAVDIRVAGLDPANVIEKLVESKLPFDKAINEFNSWTHISYDLNYNRQMTFYASINKDGEVIYVRNAAN